MIKFMFLLFLASLLFLPALAFLDAIKYKKNSNSDFVNSSRWTDGR
jgi:hypothetical protein